VKGTWKPYAIGAAALGASVIAGVGVYHMTSQPAVGFTFTWPSQSGGVGSGNDAGTLACDAPMDGLDVEASDGYYWGDACPWGSGIWTRDFTGKADPGSSISMWRDNRTNLIGTAIADSKGAWSLPGVLMPEGRHTLLVTVTLGAKSLSVSHDMYVDSTPPVFVTDAWEIPDGIDVGPDGVAWMKLCGCPDWCPNGQVQDPALSLQSCPGGYKCGTAGACHAEYTLAEWDTCRTSRRSGCVLVTSAPVYDSVGARVLELRTADFAQAGSWKAVGNSSLSTKAGSTTTRLKLDAAPAGGYLIGDVIKVKDFGSCNLTADMIRTVSAVGADYLDITVPISPAVNLGCPVGNISRFMVGEDPQLGLWGMSIGEKVQGRGHTNQPTVAAITVISSWWWVTVNSPYLDTAVNLGDAVDSAEIPTAAQQEAWWAQTTLPSWVEKHTCVVPAGYVNDDGTPIACMDGFN